MSASLKVLMVSSEILPFAKSGGLGDVLSSLSTALTDDGYEVKVVLPLYGFIDRSKVKSTGIKLSVPNPYKNFDAEIFTGLHSDQKTEIIFIQCSELFDMKGIYGELHSPYYNNSLRFSWFCKAVPELCAQLKWYPDLFHCHDWPSGLLPAFIKESTDPQISNKPVIFSIHNLGYQGRYPLHEIHHTGLPLKYFTTWGEAIPKEINFLKSAILYSDALTTVSPTYSQEILQPGSGFEMETILNSRKAVLKGILNGVDRIEWNPETDLYLSANYSSEEPENKKKVKTKLLKECGLIGQNKPLFTIISRLADQKGIKELFDPENGCIRKILTDLEVNVVVVGTGESWAEKEILKLNDEFTNFKGFVQFNQELSHRVEAAGDFFLMPSRYEPCGLNQMYSSLYGNLPIVRKTGGLADTVIPFNNLEDESTGLYIYGMEASDIFDSVEKAVWLWNHHPEKISSMMKRGMKMDFSWKKSADEYIALYKSVLEKNH